MRVDTLTDIHRVTAHLDCQAEFADQVAGVRADDASADRAMRLLVENELGEAFVAAIGDRPTRRGPRENGLAVLDPLRLALLFGQSRPRDFGIGEGDRRNLPRVEVGALP